MEEGQTILVLDKTDIAFVVKEEGDHEVYISSEIDEESETEQNFIVVLILAVLSDPEAYAKLTAEILEKAKKES